MKAAFFVTFVKNLGGSCGKMRELRKRGVYFPVLLKNPL